MFFSYSNGEQSRIESREDFIILKYYYIYPKIIITIITYLKEIILQGRIVPERFNAFIKILREGRDPVTMRMYKSSFFYASAWRSEPAW